jgi:plastocyanin
MRWTRSLPIVGALLLAGASGQAATAAKTADVEAKLGDFQVKLSKTRVPSGKITITAKNSGGMEHEIVVLKMPLRSLPLNKDGSVNEDKISATLKMGEIEHVKANATKKKTFDLKPGTYAIVCNLSTKVSDGTTMLHFPRGMKGELTVQ